MVKFEREIGTLYQIFKKRFLKNSSHDVQIKGGGGQRPFEQCSKKLHFSYTMASLTRELDREQALEVHLLEIVISLRFTLDLSPIIAYA